MKKTTLALAGSVVLLALGLLLQGLFWLVMRVPGWLFAEPRGVHAWPVVAAALALIGAGIAWLVSSRPTQAAKRETVVTAAGALVVQPFLVVTGILALLRIVDPNGMPMLMEITGGPYVLAALLFTDVGRYLAASAAALGLIAVGLTASALRERQTTTQRLPFYVLAFALLPVVALPLAFSSMPCRPGVEPDAGVEMEVVARSRWPFQTVRMCQAIAGVSPYQCEPLGWADDETLVYRVWRGAGYGPNAWRSQPGSPGVPLAYHLGDGTITRFRGDPGNLHRETCDPAACVEPALADVPSYHPGRFEDPIVSPDGRWIAFTAWPFDRPEDLLVISANSTF
ncbi:MAG: hypothetical protein PVJ55_00995 [Anaerolineae bacterium]|jgi:hypothetical protein